LEEDLRVNITVYCGAHEGRDPEFAKRAAELGRWMAEHGHRLVFGGGNFGMMGVISQAVVAAGGELTGVTPEFFVAADEVREDMTELILAKDMAERRYTMMDLADAFIALPGGTGTLDEITEVIATNRLGRLGEIYKPVMVYNVNGYYDHFIAQLQTAINEHFMGEMHASIWNVATTPEEAIEIIRNTPRWDASVRKYAAL
jgi:uncharacterized protein (TIGR00730 family)